MKKTLALVLFFQFSNHLLFSQNYLFPAKTDGYHMASQYSYYKNQGTSASLWAIKNDAIGRIQWSLPADLKCFKKRLAHIISSSAGKPLKV